jgi:hypothetical protein
VDDELYHPHSLSRFQRGSRGGSGTYVEIGTPKAGGVARLKRVFFHPQTLLVRLDTGADVTVFRLEVAKTMHIDLANYSSKDVHIMKFPDGSVYPAVKRKLDLVVGGRTIKNVPVLFPLPTTAAYNEWLVRYPSRTSQGQSPLCRNPPRRDLLGTQGILDRVLLCFDSEQVYIFHRKCS